jgi:predicted transposase YbfD/YdcC
MSIGGIATIDAMGIQKAVAEEVIRSRANYVLALTENPHLDAALLWRPS